MTEDQKKLLAVFEVRIHDLMALCDERGQMIKELQDSLDLLKDELEQTKREVEELHIKCDNTLTARILSVDEKDMKSAKTRLSKLVREVDKCIALLNG